MTAPLTGSDALTLPITPANYVTDVEGNFAKLANAVTQNYNRLTGTNSLPSPNSSVLEMNGHFRLSRMAHTKASLGFPGLTVNDFATADFADLADGTGMGHTSGSGTYNYHPSTFVGWYIAKELMLVSTSFGGRDATDTDVAKFAFGAATRVQDEAQQDRPAIYQPVSVHLPKSRWRNKQLTLEITYKTSEVNCAHLYAAYKEEGGSLTLTEAGTYLTNTSGSYLTTSLTFTPGSADDFLEIGVMIDSASAFDLYIKSIILTDNTARLGRAEPVQMSVMYPEAALAYCAFSSEVKASHSDTALIASASVVQVSGSPLLALDATNMLDPVLWETPTLYNAAVACVGLTGLNGSKIVTATDAPSATVNQTPHTTSGSPINHLLDGSYYGLAEFTPIIAYTANSTNLEDLMPHAPLSIFCEIVQLYPPLTA